jgi:hypothetical protein
VRFTRATDEDDDDELRKLLLRNMTRGWKGRTPTPTPELQNSRSETTLISLKSTPAITQGIIIHIKISATASEHQENV